MPAGLARHAYRVRCDARRAIRLRIGAILADMIWLAGGGGVLRMISKLSPVAVDVVPWDDKVTAYDEAHFACYLQLLDAEAANLPEDEICRLVLQLEPSEHARSILRSHLERAKWMTEHGYRQLLS